MHEATTTASLATAPVIFLELPWVLVTDPVQLRLLGLVPMLLKLKLARGDLEQSRELCAELVGEKVRLNLQRLHVEFAPRYVIGGPVAARLGMEQMAHLLRFARLDFLTENLHPDWRTEADPSETRAGEIAQWLAAHPDRRAGFVILTSLQTGADLPASTLSGYTVMCPPARGLTTPARDRARSVLQRAARKESDDGPEDAAHHWNSVSG